MKKEAHVNEDSNAHQQISNSCSSPGSEHTGHLGKCGSPHWNPHHSSFTGIMSEAATSLCTHIYTAPESTRGVRCKVNTEYLSFLLLPLIYIRTTAGASCSNSSHSQLGSVCRSHKSISLLQSSHLSSFTSSGKEKKIKNAQLIQLQEKQDRLAGEQRKLPSLLLTLSSKPLSVARVGGFPGYRYTIKSCLGKQRENKTCKSTPSAEPAYEKVSREQFRAVGLQ